MHTKTFAPLTIAALTLWSSIGAHADREAPSSRGRGPFAFALIGDTPYLASSMPGAPYPEFDHLAGLNRFEAPLVYTPGDNEWTDCHRINNDQYQPLERLARLRQVFFPTPGMTTVGGVSRKVPGFEEFPENVRWIHNRVVFATLHMVGSNNGLAPFQAGVPENP